MKAAVQILKKTEDLKQKLTGDILNDNEAWNNHQQLQDLYQQLLVTDLEYSLDKKVEQDLWNYGFKNQINLLQMKAKDRKNPQRNDSQESLGWFLEAASGFYLHLLQELCEVFDLDIPGRRKNSVYGMMKVNSQSPNDFHPPMKTSCLYICQHCLVHLGDIARYRNHALQAETFYRHAAELVPSNGQPYNQLAILEAAKGDKLCTVFYYVRSIAVKCPFPVSSTNLQKMFSKMATDDFQHEGRNKLSVYDYIVAFLQFHSLLHLTTGLEKAQKLLKVLSTNLTVLIATESLSAWKLIQMTAINIFAASNANRSLDANEKEVEAEMLTEDEQIAYNLVLELIASTLNGLLLLVYTIKEDADLKSYYALPVLKIIMDWLKQDLNHLKSPAFFNKLQIWPSFCKLLNAVQSTRMIGFDVSKFSQVPLPEDWDLDCFLPLHKAHKAYKFIHISPLLNNDEEHSLRASRLLDFGLWMCGKEVNGVELMTVKPDGDEGKMIFEAIVSQPPTGEVLQQLKEMTLQLSDSPEHNFESNLSNGSLLFGDKTEDGTGLMNDPILKSGITFKERKGRPNVALQTIMQKKSPITKIEIDDQLTILKLKSESKQVTFKTPSPSPPASSSGTPPLPYALSSTPSPVFHSDVPPLQLQIKKKIPGSILAQQDPHVDPSKLYHGIGNVESGPPYKYSYFGGTGGQMNHGNIPRLPHQCQDVEGLSPNAKMMIVGSGNPQSMMFGYTPNMPSLPHNRLPGNRMELSGNSIYGQQQSWPSAAPPIGIEQILSQMSFGQLMQHPPSHLPPNQAIQNVVGGGSVSNRVLQAQNFATVQRPQFNHESFMYPPLNESMSPSFSGLQHLPSSHNQSNNRQMEQQQRMLDNNYPRGNNVGAGRDNEESFGKLNSGNNTQNTYSLFNSSWSSGLNAAVKGNDGGSGNGSSSIDLGNLFQPGLQSLWSDPGRSPLERLLEQQKQKEPAPH